MGIKIKVIVVTTVIGILLSGCDIPDPVQYNIVETIKCKNENGVCLVKIDKKPWVTHVYGPAIVGDYFIDIPPVRRMGGYRLDGHNPSFKYDMEKWGEENVNEL